MSESGHADSFDAVWGEVRRWSAADRLSLASRLLASLSAERETAPGQARPADLVGAWSAAGPVDDEEVEAILNEELSRKHASSAHALAVHSALAATMKRLGCCAAGNRLQAPPGAAARL